MKKRFLFVIILAVLIVSACGSSKKSPCDGVDCSGHGECDDSTGRAVCNCDEGYVPTGQLECVEATDPCAGIECEEWERCVNGDCVPESGRCNRDEDCAGSAKCDLETNTCVGPCTGIDCGGYGECKEGGYGSGYGSGYENDADIYCDCMEGYVEIYEDGVPTCIDENEQPDDIDPENPCYGVTCSGRGECEIVNEEAVCNCYEGFIPENLSCVADPCEGVVCEEWEECVGGSCELKDGRCFLDSDCDGSDLCDDATKECVENICEGVTCSDKGICSVFDGEAVCNCEHGFKPSGTDCVIDDSTPGWCGVVWPESVSAYVGEESENIYGQIWIDGVTGSGNPQNPQIKAQLGYSRAGTLSYPVVSGRLSWIEAGFNNACESCGNNHEYMAGFPTDKAGDFEYIFRFSTNNGDSWSYCDNTPDFIQSSDMRSGIAVIKSHTDPVFTLENLSRTSNSFSYDVVYAGFKTLDFDNSVITLNGKDVTDSVIYDEETKTFLIEESDLSPGKYSYLFRMKDEDGKNIDPFFIPLWIGDGIDFADFGWRDAFVYQLMIDRFKDGDPSNNVGPLPEVEVASEQWLGGDFKGIINKIKEGYFTDMGVNALWISSPILNPHTASHGGVDPDDERYFTSYHAYHPVASGYSYLNDYGYNADNGYPEGPIETAFGTKEELHELVREAHKRGIRIIPDFVANHVHVEANLYAENPHWFYDYVPCHDNWESHRIDCWFTEYMPDFNFKDNPDARKAMIDHALWMIMEFNFDGFRADALKHMDDIFVMELKSAVIRNIETTVENHDLPDEAEIFYMVGESLGGWARYHTRADMVQGQVNEEFYNSARYYLLWGNGSMTNLASWTIENDTTYLTEKPTMGGAGGYPGAVMGNFFGNHDQDRALTEAGGDYNKFKHAQTYLMTAPINVPMLYQGDDIGMTGWAEHGLDGGRRKMMKFDSLTTNEQDALNHIKKLGNFRKEYKALRYGTRETCSVTDDAWLYKLTFGDQVVIAGLNRGSGDYSGVCSGISGTFKNLNGDDVTVTGGSVTIPARGSVVIGRK